jgi:hypothetical protein
VSNYSFLRSVCVCKHMRIFKMSRRYKLPVLLVGFTNVDRCENGLNIIFVTELRYPSTGLN